MDNNRIGTIRDGFENHEDVWYEFLRTMTKPIIYPKKLYIMYIIFHTLGPKL